MHTEDIRSILLVVCITLATLVTILTVSYVSCKESWKDSIFKSRYVVFSGCQVKDDKLGWIPSKTIRDIN